jgi:hypothetical protein
MRVPRDAKEEQEFERLGSAKTIQVKVRMIAAIHGDLGALPFCCAGTISPRADPIGLSWPIGSMSGII